MSNLVNYINGSTANLPQPTTVLGSKGVVGYEVVSDRDEVASSASFVWDTTIPQNDDGYELLTLTYTPKYIGSTLKLEGYVTGHNTAATNNVVIATICSSDSVDCLTSTWANATPTAHYFNLSPVTTIVTTSLTPITFTLRVGRTDSVVTTYNGNSGNYLDGTPSQFSITEINLDEPVVASIGEMPHYSTDEVLTERRWIDGKPIYRKVYKDFDAQANAYVVLDNIPNVNPIGSWAKSYTGNLWSIPFSHASASISCTYNPANGNLEIYQQGWDNGVFIGGEGNYFVFEYTKDSDTSSSPVAKVFNTQSNTAPETIFPYPKLGEETLTGKRHPINNKPIYTQAYYVANIGTTYDGTIATGLTGTDLIYPVHFEISRTNGTIRTETNTLVVADDREHQIVVDDETEVKYYLSDHVSYNNASVLVELEYTKTADTSSSPVHQVSVSGTAGREVLTEDRTYYVSTTGNDANDGLTSGNAFATVVKAIEQIADKIDIASNDVYIQILDGTYTESINLCSVVGSGYVYIQGNETTPDNVYLQNFNIITNSRCSGYWTIQHLKISNTSTIINHQSVGLYLKIDNVHFAGATSSGHGLVTYNGATSQLSDIRISGEYNNFILCGFNSTTIVAGTNVEFISNPSSAHFIQLAMSSICRATAITYVGSFTGKSFHSTTNSSLQADSNGTTIPGTIAGDTAEGGIVT